MDSSPNSEATSTERSHDEQQHNTDDSAGASPVVDGYHVFLDQDEDEDDDSDYRDEPNEEDEDDEFLDALQSQEFELVLEQDSEMQGDVEVAAEDDSWIDRILIDQGEDEDEDEDVGHSNLMRRIGALLRGGRNGMMTRAQMMAILRTHGRGRYSSVHNKDPGYPKVPSEAGIKLMREGAFGANNYDVRPRKHIVTRLLERELGLGGQEERCRNNDLVTQALIPGTRVEKIIHHKDPVYSGQFSDDGNFFYSCSQDFKVRVYDTSSPFNWKYYKTASYPWGQWTLTDASLSPDNRWLAYTSIQSMVAIMPTDPYDTGDPYVLELDDDEGPSAAQNIWGSRGGFGIWSIRFSGDGRELVAGTSSNSLVVYDIESRQVLHHIVGHNDHVNAVCFADKSSPHILFSGSDDTSIKMWDRRSLGDSREAGAFVGHVEGLTYIDSKGDGRYILSNGKDQTMKLWDVRMVMSTNRFRDIDKIRRASFVSGFDYRRENYLPEYWAPHPDDNSVVTFRGHKVLRTLIRCHFSPPSATNSRFVYSGSADGKVYIWNMDATLAGKIDVQKATQNSGPAQRNTQLYLQGHSNWGTCVRDASWHPNAPMVVASSWNGYGMSRGTCTVHAFNEGSADEGDLDGRRSVDTMLRPDSTDFGSSRAW